MAGIGKRFEAFRLLESISLMAFYYICFGQVWPKNMKFFGGIGARKDSIVCNTNVQHGHGVAGAGLGLLVGGPHAAGSVGHGEGEAGGGGGKYGGEDGEDEQETAEPTQAYWVVCRSEWPVLHWADPACQYSEMKAFI